METKAEELAHLTDDITQTGRCDQHPLSQPCHSVLVNPLVCSRVTTVCSLATYARRAIGMCDGDYHSILSYFTSTQSKGEDCSLQIASSTSSNFKPFWSGMALGDFVRTL